MAEQVSLFRDGRCSWCGGDIDTGAPDATVCSTCAAEARRRMAGQEPIPHKGATVIHPGEET